jgi:hypothetical protein
MKTIVRPSFWAFFDGGPSLPLPLVNGRLVPFQRPACGPLRTPVQLPQQLPDVARMIANVELLFDQVPDPLAGPQRGLIAEFLGSLQQAAHQSPALLVIQQRLAPGSPSGPQRFFPIFGSYLGPTAYGLAAYLHSAGHFALIEPFLQQLQSLKASLLQPDEIASYTSCVSHDLKDEPRASGVTLYYAGVSNQGLSGIGPAIDERTLESAKAQLIGKDPFAIEQLAGPLRYYLGQSLRTVSSLEIALWDLIGKAAGQTLYKLWGAAKDRVPAYASSWQHPSIDRDLSRTLSGGNDETVLAGRRRHAGDESSRFHHQPWRQRPLNHGPDRPRGVSRYQFLEISRSHFTIRQNRIGDCERKNQQRRWSSLIAEHDGIEFVGQLRIQYESRLGHGTDSPVPKAPNSHENVPPAGVPDVDRGSAAALQSD